MPKVKTGINESNNTTSSIQSENIKLRERVAFLESVLENLPHDLAVFDTMHRYLFINKKAIKNDHMRHWLINRTDFDYCERKNISSKVAEDREKIFVDVIGQKQKICFEETKGNEVISRNFIPVIEDAEVKYIMGYAYDVSEIKQLEQRIVTTNTELTMAMESLKEEHLKEKLRAKFREQILRSQSIDSLCETFTVECVNSLGAIYAVLHLYNPAKQVYSSHTHFSDLYDCNRDIAIKYLDGLSQTLVNGKTENDNYCLFNADDHKGMAFAVENGEGRLEGCLMLGGINEAETWKVNLLKEKAQIIAIKIIELNAQESIEQANATLQEQVKIRTLDLQEINDSLEKFSSTVSHDLKGPLRQISAFSNLLKRETANQLNENSSSYLNYIELSSKKLMNIVTALLNFSRLGKKELNKTELNTGELVNEVLHLQTMLYPKANIKITTNVTGTIYADAVLIGQVFTNLISNAIKYSSKKEFTEINISSQKDDSNVYISITDNGIGFDNSADELFKPFKRLHSDEEFEGTGLGLATVARIIQKHGGKIWAESEPGKGAKFTFRLPAS